MYKADLEKLVERLNPFCLDKMRQAAGLAVSMTHYEVTVEHLLAKINESVDSDWALILTHFGLDRGAAAKALDGALDDEKRGNAGRPALSPALIQLLQDAWMVASIELGETTVRSGALLTAFLADAGYAPTGGHSLYLRSIPRHALAAQFKDIAAASAEEADAETSTAPRPSAAGDSALGAYCHDLTSRAEAGGIDPIFGRDREVRSMIDILARRRKNNPIVVGDAGVGKTAVVEGLALRIAEGDVPATLKDTSLLALDIGLLEAGAGIRGEFEQRLKKVIEEVASSDKPIILFIDEAHTLIGAGAQPGASDAANLLKPALARGELRTIAATTWSEYKKYFEKDAALSRRFQPVSLDEPDAETTAVILRGLKDKYESAHGVRIRGDALEAAAMLADRYITGRFQPDKSVDLLDTCAARVKVSRDAKPSALEEKQRSAEDLARRLTFMDADGKDGLAVDDALRVKVCDDLDALTAEAHQLEAKLELEREAVQAVLDVREAGGDPSEPLRDLEAIRGGEAMVRYEVDAEAVAEVVSDWTGIPLGKLRRDESGLLLRLEDELLERIKGQDQSVRLIAEHIKAAKAGLTAPGAPQGVFLLIGPSGVGKTETALAVADVLFSGREALTTVNMSEFQEKHTVSRLIGSPPCYVGFGEGGLLTEAVRRRPYSALLFDEAEKADPEVMNLFYQVFDKGELSDGEGRLVDFSNTVIFLAGNLGADIIQDMCAEGTPPPEALIEAVRPVLEAHFKPALLARMTIVPYAPLDLPAMTAIAGMKLSELAARAEAENGLLLDIEDGVVERIAEVCLRPESGARAVDHYLRSTISPAMARAILTKLGVGDSDNRHRLRLQDIV